MADALTSFISGGTPLVVQPIVKPSMRFSDKESGMVDGSFLLHRIVESIQYRSRKK